MIRVATVCSGIGSPEVAINELNIEHEIVFACDIDKYARASYLSNFTPGEMYTDMTKESWEGEKCKSDLFIGGIPCQAFSLAGKRLGELDKRGLLFYDFYRYVKNQQPKVFIIENVKGLLSDAGGKTFQNWLLLLGDSVNGHHQMFNHPDSLGYNLHWTVLNSKDFGVPQNRERVFIVGIRNDLANTFRFPAGERLTLRLKDILEPVVDEKYYLSDTALQYILKDSGKWSDRMSMMNTDTDTVAGCITANHSKGVPYNMLTLTDSPEMEVIAKVNSSQDGKDFSVLGISQCLSSGHGNSPKIMVKEATAKGYAEAREGDSINISNPNSETRRGRVGVGVANTLDTACNQAVVVNELHLVGNLPGNNEMRSRIYSDIGISPTVTAKQGGGHEPKIQTVNRIRKLTPLECWRLQGFPDANFYRAQSVPTSDSQLYKQAGNSMTTKVMKAIIKNLLPILEA